MTQRTFSRLIAMFLALAAPATCFSQQTVVVSAPPTNDVASMALSPDGRTLAVVGRFNGRNHLWLRPLGNGQARPLQGTAEAVYPFWSPDGSKLGFFSEDELRHIEISTGKVTTLATGMTFPAGASWGKNGTILFSTHGRYMIWRMPETGGAYAPAVLLNGADQFGLVHPHFLPDGVNFLYYAQGKPGARGVHQGILDSTLTRHLVDAEAAAVFARDKLYYVRSGTLHARTFDPVLGVFEDDDQVVARDVPLGGRSLVALASNGDRVAYRTGPAGSARQLTWYDRRGKMLGTVGEPYVASAYAPSLSPDGKSVVINYMRDGVGEVGVVDIATGKLTAVSDDPANDMSPLWSSDGASVLYSSKRTATIETYRQAFGKPTSAERVFPVPGLRHPMDMTRDGNYLFYRRNTADVWVFDQRSMQEIPIVPPGSSRTQWPQVSPDGRWIAFQSDVTGTTQVHLHGPFEPPSLGATSRPLSLDGGGWVRWRGDGEELFYAQADGTLMSVRLTFSADGRTFTAAAPVPLFAAPMSASPENSAIAQQYLVSADGQRFLVVAGADAESPVHIAAH